MAIKTDLDVEITDNAMVNRPKYTIENESQIHTVLSLMTRHVKFNLVYICKIV